MYSLIAIAATLVALERPVNTKVELDGRTYRVEVKGRTVEVYDKSLLTKRSPEARVKLKTAVKQATGCNLVEDYWESAHLVGLLDCVSSEPIEAPSGSE